MSTLVKTKFGPIQGFTKTTEDGKNYSTFFGVPYAKQPTGDLRFRDPQPLEPWSPEVFEATKETPGAHQAVLFDFSDDEPEPGSIKTQGSDNCLTLNVFSPDLKGKLPVFVWIHGGGFISGSNSTELYGPDYLVEKDIVVVTINYRLGVVGFLSFKDESLGIPGNAGLKDQSMALRWVKENIAHFGGDPENITLGGESAGGASVHYHLLSPMSKGLFNRAIIESGSAYAGWAHIPDKNENNYEYELARVLGWNGEGGDRGAFEVIAACPIEKLLVQSIACFSRDPESRPTETIVSFAPKVEPYKGKLCFLPKTVVEMGREAWGRDVDIFIGINQNEGYLIMSMLSDISADLEKKFHLILPHDVRHQKETKDQKALAKTVKEFYFGKNDATFFLETQFDQLFGDLWFGHPTHRHILQRYSSKAKGKTFNYLCDTSADLDLQVYKRIRKGCQVSHMKGCSHADELAFIWKTIFSPKPKPTNTSFVAFQKFFNSYVSFIKTGDPNNEFLDSTWESLDQVDVEKSGFSCMKFTDEAATFEPSPFVERFRLWDKIFGDELY